MDIVKQVLDKVLGLSTSQKQTRNYPIFVGTHYKDLYTGVYIFEEVLVPTVLKPDWYGMQEYIEDAIVQGIIASLRFWLSTHEVRYEMIMPYLQVYCTYKLPTKVVYESYDQRITYDFNDQSIVKQVF